MSINWLHLWGACIHFQWQRCCLKTMGNVSSLSTHHRKALYVIKTTVRNIFTKVSILFTKVCAFTPGQASLHLILLGLVRKDTLSLRRKAYRQKSYDSSVL